VKHRFERKKWSAVELSAMKAYMLTLPVNKLRDHLQGPIKAIRGYVDCQNALKAKERYPAQMLSVSPSEDRDQSLCLLANATQFSGHSGLDNLTPQTIQSTGSGDSEIHMERHCIVGAAHQTSQTLPVCSGAQTGTFSERSSFGGPQISITQMESRDWPVQPNPYSRLDTLVDAAIDDGRHATNDVAYDRTVQNDMQQNALCSTLQPSATFDMDSNMRASTGTQETRDLILDNPLAYLSNLDTNFMLLDDPLQYMVGNSFNHWTGAHGSQP